MTETKKAAARDHVDLFLDRLEPIPDLDLEVEGIVDRIQGLQRRFRRAHEETVGERGLAWGEWKVLGSLIRSDCDSPGKLASELEVSSGAMTNRIDQLEQAGFVRRIPDPSDRRAVKLEATDEGRRVYAEALSAQARKESHVASALTKSEQKQLNTLLRKLMLEFEDG
jgi:DNA-binding MarR family transcriptional regulator